MLKFYAFQLWEWLVAHGIPLSALIIIAILIPRVGRLAIRIVSSRFDRGEEATKSRLALVGALVYVVQAIAYFAIIMLGLTNLGVPAMGAALPATVVSAAIGFGAQNVIGDFLAGFFIISERQFGVGDFVAFDGTSSNISGTVVALTLRATKIRTASGEVVMIPNGSAGVITNYSQDWSRAVVDLAVPLQPGESMAQLTDRVEATAAEALRDPTIADDVTGELEVLPATDIVAPTAAGQSWQVNFRVMVVVNPARQWAVERVLRSALVNVFWDRYDMPRVFRAGTDASAHASSSRSPLKAMAAESALAPTEVMPAQHPRPTSGHAPHGGHTAAANAEPAAARGTAASGVSTGAEHRAASDAAAAASGKTAADGTNANSPSDSAASSAEAYSPTHPASKDDGPGTAPLDSDGTIGRRSAGTPAVPGATDSVNSASAATGAANATATGTATATATDTDTNTNTDTDTDTDTEKNTDDSEQNHSRGYWRDEEHSSRFKRIMSVGGRTRPSTTGLIIALMVVGGLALASSNPDGRDAGWLSPDYWRDRPANSATTNKKESDENQPTGTNGISEQQAPDNQQPTDGEQSPTGSEQSPAQGSDSPLNDQDGQSNQNPSDGDSNSPGNNPSDGSVNGGAGGNGGISDNGGAGTNGGAGNSGANSNGAAGGAAGGGAGGNAGAAGGGAGGGGAQNNVSNEPKDSEFDAFDSPASNTRLHALGAPNATNATRD
ncbi:mechanosensitive ion channel family protein [Corynebacterium macclintockiae]|uniref:mechanosensitive ion channel family protein n=1 Tax=Corynebacterium macclintockiae TaxID=2913501 RepID=UPI003EB83B74